MGLNIGGLLFAGFLVLSAFVLHVQGHEEFRAGAISLRQRFTYDALALIFVFAAAAVLWHVTPWPAS